MWKDIVLIAVIMFLYLKKAVVGIQEQFLMVSNLYALFVDGFLTSLMILLIDTKKDGKNNNIRQFYTTIKINLKIKNYESTN